MVQVLERIPSFGERFANQLTRGLGAGVSQASEFAQKMALEKQKTQPLMSLLMGQKGTGQAGGGFQPLNPDQEAMLAFTDPSAFNAYNTLKQGYQKEQEKGVVKEDLSNVLSQMTQTLQGGNLGYTAKKYTSPQGRRDAQYFDSLGVQLESIAKDMISKGVLARDRFAYLLSNLPSSKKTDAANAGAIEAWADELHLPRPEGLEQFYKKEKSSKKSSGNVTMTDSEGNRYNIPADMVKQAENQGFKRS